MDIWRVLNSRLPLVMKIVQLSPYGIKDQSSFSRGKPPLPPTMMSRATAVQRTVVALFKGFWYYYLQHTLDRLLIQILESYCVLKLGGGAS